MDRDLDNGKESAVIDTEGRAGRALVVWLRGWKLIYKYRRRKIQIQIQIQIQIHIQIQINI